MPAKIAYAQWPWGTKTKEQFIESCKDLSDVGFEYFESVREFVDTFKDNPKEFDSICEEYGMHPISFYFHLRGNPENDIFELKDKIKFIADRGIKTITVQSVGSKTKATPEQLEYAIKTLTEYGNVCKEYGIIPCLHPHINTTVMYRDEIEYVMSRLDPELVGFAPDTAHLLSGKCDPTEVFNAYADRIKFVHLKDLEGPTQVAGMQAGVEIYTNFLELGQGVVDFKGVFDVLKRVDFDGYLCLELDCTRYTNKESAIMNYDYMKKNW